MRTILSLITALLLAPLAGLSAEDGLVVYPKKENEQQFCATNSLLTTLLRGLPTMAV